jgi:hypothetical protein
MVQNDGRDFNSALRTLEIIALRAILVVALVAAGWYVYRQLPATSSDSAGEDAGTSLQIVLRRPESAGLALDVPVNLYPVDIVAVQHEFFSEPRAGKRYDDFLKERMKGRTPIKTRLDKEGHGSVTLAPGSWWLHVIVSGDEQIEWRLPVRVGSGKQTVELTPQNAYTRSKSF